MNEHNPYCLITGASSGIGLELAHLFAKDRINLILVARSTDKLTALSSTITSKYPVIVYTITKDLSQPDSADQLFQQLKEKNISVSYLVNNAGFGDYGPFLTTSPDKEEQMLQLNIVTLYKLCKLFAPEMAKNGKGRILNISSVAAFMPGPYMAVYFASKAFVLSLSEALSFELKTHNLSVTTLCPGPTETGFAATANAQDTKSFQMFPLATGKKVAQFAYRGMMKGRRTIVYGFSNRLLVFICRLMPRRIVLWLSGIIMKPEKTR